jgi:hypothetical protein
MATDKMAMSLDALIKAQRADRSKASGKGKKGKLGKAGADDSGSAKLAKDALVAAVGARSKAQRADKIAQARGMDIDSVPVPVVAPRSKGRGGKEGGSGSTAGKKKKGAIGKGAVLGSELKAKLQANKAQAGPGGAGKVLSPRSVQITIPGPAASGSTGSQSQPAAGTGKKTRAKGGRRAAGAVQATGRAIGKKARGGKPNSLAEVMAMSATPGAEKGARPGPPHGVKKRQGGAKGAATKGKFATKAKKQGGGLSARFSS